MSKSKMTQAEKNTIIELAKFNTNSGQAIVSLINGGTDEIMLRELSDEALTLALHIRELIRPKNIVETKGQRA